MMMIMMMMMKMMMMMIDDSAFFMSHTFFCFVAFKSTAKVMAGRSVHLTTLFPGQV